MATKADWASRTIARKLGIFLLLFYVYYYVASIIFVGAFEVDWSLLGGFPFRTTRSQFDPGAGGGALGAWLAMLVAYIASLGLAYFVVAATRRSWDYVITTSIVHWVLCCLVDQQFPVNWIWWVTISIASLVVSVAAELAIYLFKDLQDIELEIN